MVDVREIHIGSFIRNNKGEVIRVDSIGTKRQNRKVGYHAKGEPCRIRYVRLLQCEGIPTTAEILTLNGFDFDSVLAIWTLNHNGRKFIIDGLLGRMCVYVGHINVDVSSVHLLQNLMSAAGLDDIACNLKLVSDEG